jgi:ABC-type Mn2+/Zn2+ transport system ATPase subunit
MPLPTNKISKIHLSNFKFFDKNRVIDLANNDHLLIYGENGSGKSSIYWALYTLLDSVLKESKAEIEKYFAKGGKDNLINIYATSNRQSYIKLELTDGNFINLSPTDLSIFDNPIAKAQVEAINLASDFINYRMLYRFHEVKHSKDFEVFDFLFAEILTYLTIPSIQNKKANLVWEELLKGPEKDFDMTGTEVYPIPNDIMISNPQLVGLQNKYKSYRGKLREFNKWLKALLFDVESVANDVLENDLNQPFKIKIIFKPKDPFYDREKPEINSPKIYIEVPIWNGIKNKIKKPHTFLNEARLTALAIAFRIGILKSRATLADIRFLVLDDLLISLDMGNRDSILNLIIKKLSNDYQLLILTHDYNFFDFAKDKINKFNKELVDTHLPQKKWTKLEMYEFRDGNKITPNITPSKTALEKAKKYFYGKTEIDLAACGNNLRKATENFCENFLPISERHSSLDYKKLDLAKLIQKTPIQASIQGLSTNLFIELDGYRQTIFNPQSHYNLTNPPLFKGELEKSIKTLEMLEVLTGIKL